MEEKYIFNRFYVAMKNLYRNKHLSLEELNQVLEKAKSKKCKNRTSQDFQDMVIEILENLKIEKENKE